MVPLTWCRKGLQTCTQRAGTVSAHRVRSLPDAKGETVEHELRS